MGPTLPVSAEIHATKYRTEGETFEQAMTRIANALKDDQPHFKTFREILIDMRFLPGGRVQAAMGAPKSVTAFNCLSGDTEIATANGFVRLLDYVGATLSVLSPVSGAFHPAVVKTYGEQMLNNITISTSNRNDTRHGTFTVQATANHRWVLQTGDVTTELRVGDVLMAGDCNTEANPAGFVHGFIFGDGSRQRPGKFVVRLCGDKVRHLQTIQEGYPVKVTYPPSNEGDPNVTIVSEVDMKRLPTSTMSATYIRGFVCGLLAADGCFKVRDGEAFIFSGTEETVRWMRDHLVYAGYAPSGRAYMETDKPTNFGKRTQPLWRQLFRPVNEHKGYRVVAISPSHSATVYCVEEPAHRQIVLRNGLRTGQCFVAPTIEDAFTDGENSIMGVAAQAAQTMRLGGGIGYDFSTLRPRGDLIRKLGSQSSGPVSFMHIFDAVCKCVASSGHRRGAQMGVLRVDHPNIFEFINAKKNQNDLTGFNISVAITDEFMHYLDIGKAFPLRFGGVKYREVDPAELWDAIMRNTWDWAEPGVLFIDQINRMNNLWYTENIACTNPCGEQPLPPHGACLLGSFNLVKYLNKSKSIDFDRLERDIPSVVRAMDNVTDKTEYPLPQQGREARAKRRMGLGVTGLANALEAGGSVYGSPEFVSHTSRILEFINHHAYLASVQLAREKGAFALFDKEHYLAGKFVETLDKDVRRAIRKYGIRNSHLTSIAPTGTISLSADNISSGIEPVFSYAYDRTIQTFDGPTTETITDYGVRELGVRGKKADEVEVEEHVAVLCAAQQHVDSAVSKTCNVGAHVTFDRFKDVYRKAWEAGAKGITTFRPSGKRYGILVSKDDDGIEVNEGAACKIDLVTGARSCE